MFTVSYSCRIEISQDLPDNTPIRSLEELTEDFKGMLDKALFPDMDIKISHCELTKTASTFD